MKFRLKKRNGKLAVAKSTAEQLEASHLPSQTFCLLDKLYGFFAMTTDNDCLRHRTMQARHGPGVH